jgi:hypothetical protein
MNGVEVIARDARRPAAAAAAAARVTRRRFPHPYRALLAISSDLDETPDRSTYLESLRYLNTRRVGPMGPGLGLEVAHSIYFDMPADQFAYWNTDDTGRAMVRDLIRSGHIDVLHSFGDRALTRAHAARALEELERHGCRLEVWVDHGVAPTNLDGGIMRGSGDVVGAPAYHADLSCAHGIQYVWRGRVTSVIGQDAPRRPRHVFTLMHPILSGRTLAKELAKGALARLGHAKYAMHAGNAVLRPVRLRSGHRVHEFLRSNPHWGGVSVGETADGIASVLVPSMLRRLLDREGVCLLYTHLGKTASPIEPFGPATRLALRQMARLHHDGHLLVTTTRRALGYCRARTAVTHETARDTDGALRLSLRVPEPAALGPADLEGLTYYVPDPARVRVCLDGREVAGVHRNPPDHTGRPSVSLPWRRLEFPR